MEDRTKGLQSPLDASELDALASMNADEILDDLDMSWHEPGEPSDATNAAAENVPRSEAKKSRYKPRAGAVRERNIEVQRRYRQRIKEKARETEEAIAATAAEIEAARAEQAALQGHHRALESLAAYSYSVLAALRTFSASLGAAAGQYFHAVQLRVATLHAGSIEAMFNAVRRPTDAQLRALAADIDAKAPMLGCINVEFMAQLVSLMSQWTASGAHGRVVIERKLKILFETRERFITMLIEFYPEKAAALMERMRVEDRAMVQARAEGGFMAAALEDSTSNLPLSFIFDNSVTLGSVTRGDNVTAALAAQRASTVAHPDLQAAVVVTDAQKEVLGEAWGTFIHAYNSRIRGRVGSAVRELEATTGEAESSMRSIGSAELSGHRAVEQLESFGREEVYARVALAQRAFKVLEPLQIAYICLMQLPNADIVMMYRRMLAFKLDDLPEAVRPHLGVYFEDALE
jgi:hypothetical protein